MQITIVICCIIAAMAYATFRIRKTIRQASDPCAGCQGCALKEAKQKNQACDRKKQAQKFGR